MTSPTNPSSPDVTRDAERAVVFSGAAGTLLFAHATFMLFLTQEGVSLATIGALQALQTTCMLVLEIPGGVFADRVGRHVAIALGRLLWGASYLLMALSQSPLALIASFVCLGVGVPLTSGADTALLSGIARKREEATDTPVDLTRLLGRYQAVCSVGLTLALVVGAALAGVDLRLALIASAVAQLIGAVVILRARDFDREAHLLTPAAERTSSVAAVFRMLRHRSSLRRLMIALALADGVLRTANLFGQQVMSDAGVVVVVVGLVYAAESVLTALGSHRAWRLERRVGTARATLLGLVMIGVALAALASSLPAIAVLGFLGAGLASSVIYTTGDSALATRIDGAHQATLFSVVSAGAALVTAAFSLLLGALSDSYGLGPVLAIGGGTLTLAALVAATAGFREEVTPVSVEA